ncbi:hypothetical protein TNIN_335601 [Trichonephila inaurata madagascariensis]|uniref:Uncharacterized protein n=1 Tax=Trichonephila inaurata madagascariensis TaxID=2747483 RepID=A0A8X6Y2W4_9ARAC|nr:hypothetical protein TNIN_335601 [Trichonephila inaurata madagascariensis]
MELSLHLLPTPLSTGKPDHHQLQKLQSCKDIEKFGIVIEIQSKSSLRGLQIAGIDDVSDPTFLDRPEGLMTHPTATTSVNMKSDPMFPMHKLPQIKTLQFLKQAADGALQGRANPAIQTQTQASHEATPQQGNQ